MSYPSFSVGEVLTAADMNAVGMWLVKTQTIGTAVSSITVGSAFSSSYDAYRIVITGGVGSTDLDLRFNFDGNTANYYGGVIYHPYATASGNAQGLGRNNIAYWDYVGNATTSTIAACFDVLNPFAAKNSGYMSQVPVLGTGGSALFASGFHNSATSFTGFRIETSTGTLTGGTIRVYGYRN